tara:strand:- start:2732 stop:2980 length:249 start_codon:yes stop_codon:yes gene_type:complete
MLIDHENNTAQFSLDDLDKVSDSIKSALRCIRLKHDKPLEGYEPENGVLSEVEEAQEFIFDVATTLGINLGAKWGISVNVTR